MPATSPQERTLIARIAAHEQWAKTSDRTARTATARRASLDRFEKEVDPQGILDPAVRAQRAAHARSAHFSRLALRSAQSRRRAADARATSARLDAAAADARRLAEQLDSTADELELGVAG